MTDIRIEIKYDTAGFKAGMQELFRREHQLRRLYDELYDKLKSIQKMKLDALCAFLDSEPEWNSSVILIPEDLLLERFQ